MPHDVTLSLTERQAQRLAAVCAASGRTADSHLDSAIERYLATQEVLHPLRHAQPPHTPHGDDE
nr:hypothetical protein [Corynebacterium lactis]